MEQAGFSRAPRHEMKYVDAPLLADPVHTADSLLEPHRIPRQFEIDDSATVLVQVQAFAGGIDRQQHTRRGKRPQGRSPLFACHPAVDDRGVRRNLVPDVQQGVAVLGEDNDGLID